MLEDNFVLRQTVVLAVFANVYYKGDASDIQLHGNQDYRLLHLS